MTLALGVAALCAVMCIGRVAAGDPAPAPKDPITLDIIKETQNPLTRALASFTFENSATGGLGANDKVGYEFLIKPSFPIVLSDQWSLINRSVLPVLEQPSPVSSNSRNFGLGDLTHVTLLSPTTTRAVIWGLGPLVGFPTATEDELGTGRWLAGPAAIFVYAPRRSVFGLLAEQVWSFAGDSDRNKVSKLGMRPLVNINLANGWYLTSKPNISADWKAERSGDTWLVEAGGGVGKVFRIGNFGISLETQFFGYPAAPRGGPSWSARLDIKILFRRGLVRERILKRVRGEPLPPT